MDNIYDFFAKPKDPKIYTGVQISLASSDQIREWSHGEIKKPETINYRTFKPERDGLFCAKVFGPTKDYECNCGKYKRMKHRGVVCEKCGVEVIQSKVRRERMAHIELASPVSHIWFLKSLPSKIGNVLDLTLKNLEKVLYFDSYLVIDPKDTGLKKLQLLSDDQYYEALETFGDEFEAGIGAEAILKLLEEIDLQAVHDELKEEITLTKSVAKKQKMAKRLRVIDAFLTSGIEPTRMIMTACPILPPDLRPLVPLEGGRFATSDLNDLYRRVLNRNNRLKRLVDLNAPDIIVRNEKRMLQEAVDVLFDNGRHGRVVTGPNKRPLKSLSDTLKGKQGRFRQNLLGKRVDYSGRTVITVGSELRLHQCGIPKKMALELFKPFIYNYLEQKGLVSTVKSAKKMVEREETEVWDALESVVKEYPVMLNRAPTLHRLGFQAFEPVLIEGKAIQLHPLVCPAFNADFDGDQMAVHVPLSLESQLEARIMMLSTNNILSPANGQPIIVPTQDIVLGIYYMTRAVKLQMGEGVRFSSIEEVRYAFDAGELSLHAKIKVRIDGEMYDTTTGRILLWETIPGDILLSLTRIRTQTLESCEAAMEELKAGKNFNRVLSKYSDDKIKKTRGKTDFLTRKEFKNMFQVSEIVVEQLYGLKQDQFTDIRKVGDYYTIFRVDQRKTTLPFNLVNRLMDKSSIVRLIDYAYRNIGLKETVILSDRLKDIGYKYSTLGGLSICVSDMIIPDEKWDIIAKSEKNIEDIKDQYSEGLITQGEKYNKVVDIWAQATDDIANAMMEVMKNPKGTTDTDAPEELNAVYVMADSGARGSKDQMRQLAGMRGLMAKPSGEIIENPITANFREGLSVLQYFISTHGARKGLADTALKTANSGYLTRRLADVGQDCTIVEPDCGTINGIEVESLYEGGEVIQTLGERILGRVTQEDIHDPYSDEFIVGVDTELSESDVKRIEAAGVQKVKIRSVLTCNSKHGVCSRCYGRDLAHGVTVEIGQAIGIVAAQSIGEPGTQLTMRTFHIGGTASRKVEVAEIKARVGGILKYNEDIQTVVSAENQVIVMNRKGGGINIVGEEGRERAKETVIYGATLHIPDGKKIEPGDVIATWDPFTTPIITEVTGRIRFADIEVGNTVQEQIDQVTGKVSRTIIEGRDTEIRPRITIKDKEGKGVKLPNSKAARYYLPVNAILTVDEDDQVMAGDVIGKLPRATTKTKDITGGLPRVAELFEVRKPKDPGMLTEIDGYVSVSKGTKGRQKVTITPADVGEKKEYSAPKGQHVTVYDGDYVKAGDPLIAGSANPQDIMNIKGEVALAKYLVDEVQEVYRLQGVRINDKHIEVVIRQMMRRVKVISTGDTNFIPDEQVDRIHFEDVNREVAMTGGEPAKGEPLILGITKASLSTDSFLSAASFQETTKVLTLAAIEGKYDGLKGLKENVVMGRLIPAGTGFSGYQNVEVGFGVGAQI
ncbi:MAG: DNA-directed RNA polymerase subunit beta' [Desulfobacula sp.]|uniref:DNA-directed RNA polymerase subunit beta' n=1 Tax=Desulfobacula sp. TaxID=2593537 RepID=UPI001D748346|nr:DNA-directed RNA polymerase subunit beta' [Desulfobacula sp.]MBT3804723.1 DNA-directed RNA polymerase subunit beta' [Desulfobacula sp.]MBT4024073.1 DNA-directed RNA polymerase subunit beta' [Desulfobacula sp.]MBT4198435.1 DNA-directed RNA polymerase subunit beta' [Desulfobacula sp.]MBT4506173.1 DNA-directed RNA polymerase subunit beta' [Desulfobacula sp.]